MTEHQKKLMKKLNELAAILGYYQGALKGAYFDNDETLTKIALKENDINKVLLNMQDLILE